MLAKTMQRSAGSVSQELQVIFDVETLLLDPGESMRESLRIALVDSGLTTMVEQIDGSALVPKAELSDLLAEMLKMRDSARAEAALRRFSEHYSQQGRYRCRFRPGSLQLLATLAATPGVAMHYMTHIGAAAAARVLDIYGLQQMPRSIYTGANPCCPGMRPTLLRDWLEYGAQGLGNWLLLSDSQQELLTAKRLGIRAIGLGYGRVPQAMLRRLSVDSVVSNLPEVTSLLLNYLADGGARRSLGSSEQLHLH